MKSINDIMTINTLLRRKDCLRKFILHYILRDYAVICWAGSVL